MGAATDRDGAGGRRSSNDAELAACIRSLVRFVLSTTTPQRSDRIWPGDSAGLVSNTLSIAFGAAGTAVAINRSTGGIPEAARDWLVSKAVSEETLPPGLYTGLSGIGLCFAELGELDRAQSAMRAASRSSILFADPSYFQGVAGWGFAALQLYAMTGLPWNLDLAVQAGDYLEDLPAPSDRSDSRAGERSGSTWLGIARGPAGIALFLLRLHQITGEQRYLKCALREMDGVLAHAVATDSQLKWPQRQTDTSTCCDWFSGTAGIAAVLIRFAEALRGSRFTELATKAAEGAFVALMASPSQAFGLAGIGELMLDCGRLTNQPAYLERAQLLARRALWFAIPREAGLAIAGRGGLRLSVDFATGSAGLILFLKRVIEPGPRWLHDLPARTGEDARELIGGSVNAHRLAAFSGDHDLARS